MRTLAVVESEILGQSDHPLAYLGIAFQIHVFVLDVAPEPFDEDVVKHASSSIPADDNAFSFQHVGEGLAGELRALVAVEDFRLAMSP